MVITTFALNRFNDYTNYWFLLGFIFVKEFFNLLMIKHVFTSTRKRSDNLRGRDIVHLPVCFLVRFLPRDIYSEEKVPLANRNWEYPIYESLWNVYRTVRLKNERDEHPIIVIEHSLPNVRP